MKCPECSLNVPSKGQTGLLPPHRSERRQKAVAAQTAALALLTHKTMGLASFFIVSDLDW